MSHSEYQLIKHMKACVKATRFAEAAWAQWHLGNYAEAQRLASIAERINPDVDRRDPYRVIATHEALPAMQSNQPVAQPAQLSLFAAQ